MQIIMELSVSNEEFERFGNGKETKAQFERRLFYEILLKLEKDGYRINTLYGLFIYDHKKNVVIDCGKSGDPVKIEKYIVDQMFFTGAKMAIIFVDEKYVVLDNKYFVAIHFSHMRKVRPISLLTFLYCYDDLINNKNEQGLNDLYYQHYLLFYGADVGPIPHLFDKHNKPIIFDENTYISYPAIGKK